MKQRLLQIIVIALFAALAFPSIAFAQGSNGDKFIFGGEYTLKEDQTIQGSLMIFGGKVTLKEGSLVKGDVLSMGGTLYCNGTVRKDILAMGGSVELQDAAVVEGGVSLLGAQLERADKASVEGEIQEGQAGAFQWTQIDGAQLPEFQVIVSPIADALRVLLQSFLWAALAILIVLFLPHQTERAAQTAFAQPIITGSVGLMTAVIFPIALLIMVITIILIPAGLLLVLALAATWAFGVVSLGSEVGRRMGDALKQNWALPVAAGIGTFALTLLVSSVANMIPCIGWLAPFLIGALGVGAILLTRFGTQNYPPMDPLAFAAAVAAPDHPPYPAAESGFASPFGPVNEPPAEDEPGAGQDVN